MIRKSVSFAALLIFAAISSPLFSQNRMEKIERTFDIKGDEPFYLELNIDAGQVAVKRNSNPAQIDFAIDYSMNEYDYDFDFSENNRTLTFFFDKKDWVDTDNNDGKAEIEVWLPANVELEMRSKIKAGEVRMDIGGLSLRDFRLKIFAGEVVVDFAEPNKIVMNSSTSISKWGKPSFAIWAMRVFAMQT